MPSKIGLIGLGTMGSALAQNLAAHGFKVSIWNRTREKMQEFIAAHGEESFHMPKSLEGFVESLEWPRKIIVMVPAGEPTVQVLKQLAPVLGEEDVIIDASNAIFRVTEIYQQQLETKKIQLLGVGISGGEEGALKGPSIMPGGDKEAYDEVEPILSAIAAEDFNGKACVSYMGKKGSGHYVKMVHNGIEYAEIQMLAEAYDLLKTLYKLKNDEIAEIFANWNEGRLNSYLTEISVEVLKKEEDGKPLIDLILDKAGQKGTGQWTSQEALALGISAPSITGAVFMRYQSTNKIERTELSKLYPVKRETPKMLVSEFAEHLEKALFATRISNFEQGLSLLRAADVQHKFELNIPEAVRIWQGGCIIRCELLRDIHSTLKSQPQNLYATDFAHTALVDSQKSWRQVVQIATEHSIPMTAIPGALTHFEASRSSQLPANFIQGLRDHFGSHGYQLKEDAEN